MNNTYEAGQLFDGRYKLIDTLSTAGGSADVWLAIDTAVDLTATDESRATKVAIKIYRPKNLLDAEGDYQFRSEFKKVFNCHHENIIQPTYFSVYDDNPYLVMPYCPSGSSEKLVGKLVDKDDLWKYIYEVASGLAYLHAHTPQIIHQDIKPANVLIDDNGNFAITDFGISAEMGGADSADESGGTLAYMAPERFVDGCPPMSESDIWALGATLYELVTGDTPFGNDGGALQQKNTPLPPIKQKIPASIKKLIYSCLSYNTMARPTAKGIVNTVLKRRYAKNTRLIAAMVTIAVGLTGYLILKQSAVQFSQSCDHADSIVNNVLEQMKADSVPMLDCIVEFDKAIVLYDNACKDAPEFLHRKKLVSGRVAVIRQLKEVICKYDTARDLSLKAKRTEMEEEYLENYLLQEQYRDQIDELISLIR